MIADINDRHTRQCRVWLDGVEVTRRCVRADDQAGVVTCLQVHPDGSPVRNESQTSFATEELRGVVRIEFPPDI